MPNVFTLSSFELVKLITGIINPTLNIFNAVAHLGETLLHLLLHHKDLLSDQASHLVLLRGLALIGLLHLLLRRVLLVGIHIFILLLLLLFKLLLLSSRQLLLLLLLLRT
jgi:hypothetical protein